MRAPLKQTQVEWGFVLVLAVLCAVLTTLQYRWTGDLARAEAAQLAAGLRDRTEQLCRAFDTALTESRAELMPRGGELASLGREGAHVKRLRLWAANNPRPIFRRLAVAVPEPDGLQFFTLDQKAARLVSAPWPAEWAGLRDNLARKSRNGGSPPFCDPAGALIEFPIFGDSAPRESEWMIFELDLDYARDSWLPALVRTYLNPDNQPLNDVEVTTIAPPLRRIYATRDGEIGRSASPVGSAVFSARNVTRLSHLGIGINPAGTDVISARFNRLGRDNDDRRGPGGELSWLVRVRPRPGAMEALVAVSRRRNLALAGGLNILLLAAGIALVRYTRRSRQLAEARMNFVATVSHELRTPLTVIRGAGHNLARGVVREPEQIAQYAKLIVHHAEQLGEMVEQVLGLAGANGNRSGAVRQPVALAEVLNEAVAATADETRAANCAVHVEVSPALPLVTGDASALRRVFQNLISNAAKHGGAGGWVGVSAAIAEGKGPRMIEVRVADGGPGIPAGELADIFTPFFRGTEARAKQVRGSGLGLSLVREIVGAHGGKVRAISQYGEGVTIIVHLPAIAEERQ